MTDKINSLVNFLQSSARAVWWNLGLKKRWQIDIANVIITGTMVCAYIFLSR